MIASRSALQQEAESCERRFAERAVPRPPFWGGFRLVPVRAEFWQGQTDRLHDRLRYRREAGGWRIERLAP